VKDVYTVSQNNCATFIFTLTLANVGRFLKFFQCRNQKEMAHNKNETFPTFPPLLNFVATLPCKTNTSVNVNFYNNAVLLSDAKFKQNMTKKVTKSWQNQDNQ